MASDGKKDSLIVKVHPEVALYVLEHEHDLIHKLEKSVGFSLYFWQQGLLFSAGNSL